MPRRISLDARRLSVTLGLGPMLDRQPCMGYYNACICDDCLDRANDPRGQAKRAEPTDCTGGYTCECQDCVNERAELVAAKAQPREPRDDLDEPAAVRFARPDLLAA